MTVIAYVESNFILEIALQEAEGIEAEAILRLAEAGDIELKMPDVSLREPFSTITRRRNERQVLAGSLHQEVRRFARSTLRESIETAIQPAIASLLAVFDQQLALLDGTLTRMLRLGPLVSTDAAVYEESVRYRQAHGLRSEDALIYAAVMKDLRARAQSDTCVFLNRNAKDFASPDIAVELQSHNCRFISRFPDGLRFLRSALRGRTTIL